MPLPNLKKLFAGSIAESAKTIGDTVKQFITTKKDKLDHEETMTELDLKIKESLNSFTIKLEELALQETEAYLKDMSDARNREIQIATSEKAPLINKIIQPILALFIVVATLTIWALILFRNYEPKTNEAMIVGALTTLAANVLSYYFGSSTGSKAKQEQLDKISNR